MSTEVQFQSTHPHGVRRISIELLDDMCTEFQSTHPHGVRLVIKDISHRVLRFNPRTRTGCDQVPSNTSSATASQSTHPHGVRLQVT